MPCLAEKLMSVALQHLSSHAQSCATLGGSYIEPARLELEMYKDAQDHN